MPKFFMFCWPSRRHTGPFTRTLSTLQLRGLCENCVPTVLKDCIEYLRHPEIIKRRQFLVEIVDPKQIERALNRIICGKPPKYTSASVAFAVLKRFLVELPADLGSDRVYWTMATGGFTPLSNVKKTSFLMRVLHEQPHRIRTNLCYIMGFLSDVHMTVENEMDARDLATIFAPIIIRQGGTSHSACTQEALAILVYFIENYDDVMTTLNGFESINASFPCFAWWLCELWSRHQQQILSKSQ